MARFEIYKKQSALEKPILFDIWMNGEVLRLVAVREDGTARNWLLELCPNVGLVLIGGCDSDSIGMPVDEHGCVKIATKP